MARIAVANPTDRDMTRGPGGTWQTYLFSFGAYGDTRVLAYGSSMDDALEEAAEWLAEHAPGHLIGRGSDELNELVAEAREEWVNDHERYPDEEEMHDVFDRATADLTYTEAGYLTSYEWTVRENPTKAELVALAKERR